MSGPCDATCQHRIGEACDLPAEDDLPPDKAQMSGYLHYSSGLQTASQHQSHHLQILWLNEFISLMVLKFLYDILFPPPLSRLIFKIYY